MKNFKRVLMVVVLCSFTTLVFAEDDAAPVYDVDNMPPQFDGQVQAPSDSVAQPLATQPLAQSHSEQVSHSSSGNLEQRLGQVEQQVNNMEQSTATPKVDQLQSEIQSLRGQVEELNHQLQKQQTLIQSMTADVDKRINKQLATLKPQAAAKPESDKASNEDTNATTTAPKVVAPKTASHIASKENADTPAKPAVIDNQPNVAEEQQTYQTAYDLIKAKKYDDAITSLQKMLQKYPSGQFAANAHYWLGELYGLTGKNDQSATEFKSVVQNFSDSPKVADAQLKLGLILAGQTKWSEAKSAFKKVINKYPGTASARLAMEQLKQIKQSGH